MSFEVIKQSIPEVLLIKPNVYEDERGYFKESYNLNDFEEFLPGVIFVQDNESKSARGVLRGLHFQKPPFEQAKLVRVVQGSIWDVAVDIRRGSPTFKQFAFASVTPPHENSVKFPSVLLMFVTFIADEVFPV